MTPKQPKILIRLLLLFLVIILTVALILNKEKIIGLEKYGYPGIFLISILANATVIFPIPGVLMTSAFGMIFDPIIVAIAAGSGATIGELTGYLAGFSGSIAVENQGWYMKMKKWMGKYGEITVFLMAFIPNPIFDIAGIAAGSLKLPLVRFLFWCWMGKLFKMLIFAFTGRTIFALITSYVH